MKQYMELSCVPCDEPCTGAGDNPPQERKECRAYKRQLERMAARGEFGPDGGAYFGVKRFPHDFGGYTEVVVYYDENDPVQCEFAANVESNLPATWDAQAKIDLLPPLADTLSQIPADLAAGPESRYS